MLGLWWLANPSDANAPYEPPSHRVSGELTDNDVGPWSLSIIGSLLAASEVELFKSLGNIVKKQDAIWGTNTDGECCSLFDTWRSSVSWQSSNPVGGVEDWHIGWYTSGQVWVTKDEEVDLVSVRFDLLDDWASAHLMAGHEFKFEDNSLKFPKPQSHSASTDGITITLTLDGELQPDSGGYRVSRYSSFDIQDSVRLEEVVDKWVLPLKTLLELLSGSPARVTHITVQVKELRETPQRFLQLHPSILQSTEERDSSRGQLDMFATRSALAEHGLGFSSLMQNYGDLQLSERHRTALNYLGHSQSRLLDQSADSELLSTVKAVELFHSEAIDGTVIPAGEHEQRISDIVQGAPKKWRSWVRERLAGSNHKGLKRQIAEVQARADDTGVKIEQVWPKFARHMAKCRSKAAHGGPTGSGNLGLRYHAGAMALRWLLRHVYLLELGMSAHNVNLIVQNSDSFNHEMQLLLQWQDQILDQETDS